MREKFIKRRTFYYLLVFFWLCVFVLPAGARQAEARKAKYVFYFIGDGLGIPQRSAAEEFSGRKLLMNTFPVQGLTTTYAADRFITGSAAAVTALACGHKTNIGMIGLTPDGRPIKSVAELARDRGMKVGIISTVSIDHATPAGFYAHVKKRSQYYDIAIQLAQSGFDFFGGGGLKDPTNKKNNSVNYQGNAIDIIKSAGYRIIQDKGEFNNLKKGDKKVIVINPWLQDAKAEPYSIDQTSNDISLAELTAKAVELLENRKGFFIMVEGGKIDWACHANDAVAAIIDTLAFDDAIKVAYDFYLKHPKDTLIVVTGDHETGGLTLGFAGTKYATYFDILHHQDMSFQRFTDEIVHSLKENKGITFEDVKPLITQHFGLKFSGDPSDPMVLKTYEVVQLMQAFEQSMKDKIDKHDPQTYLLYGGYEPLAVTITHILNNKAGVAWTSYKHTGVPVPTSAIGRKAELFSGYYDNTDIAKRIMQAMGFKAKIYYVDKQDVRHIALAGNF